MKPIQNTPWGPAQTVEVVGTHQGHQIVHVTTASHGGYYVPLPLLLAIPPAYRLRAQQWSGSPHWFEEDCEWASVAVTFPDLFPVKAVTAARETIAWRERA